MRVLQIVQTPQRRGAEIFAYDLSQELERQNHSTKIIYLYEYGGDEALPLRPPDVCLGGIAEHWLERSFGFQPRLLHRLQQEIKEFAPDIVQLNGARSVKYGALAKLFSTPSQRWKLVYRTINIPSHWQKKRWILQVYKYLIMPRMDGVISVCTPALRDARELYGLDVPATVVLNGFDPSRLQLDGKSSSELRRENGVHDEDIILLFLGSLVPQKRPDRFIRLISSLVERDPRFRGWIVGDGYLRQEAETQARELGIADKVKFFGYQSKVGIFMRACDLYILTSDTEGLPATVLEAGFLGVPVISTDVGGVYEAVINGQTGVLVPSEDEAGLSDSVFSLTHDKALIEQMSTRSRELFEAEFTIARIANQYMNFYQILDNQ